jgi:hypothetical protein
MERIKYPRTYHLPFSKGLQSDDKLIETLDTFKDQEVIATIKMDGENTTLTSEFMHARSVDSPHNFTRDWVKKMHSIIKHEIPENWRFCGENVAYYHSIEYNNLESFFYLFSIWNEKNECLSWDDMMEWANVLDLATPEVVYRGVFDVKKLEDIANKMDVTKNEGFTVRLTKGFHFDDFGHSLTKFVREGHVQPDNKDDPESEASHWLKRTYPNKLADVTLVKPAYMSQKKKNKFGI